MALVIAERWFVAGDDGDGNGGNKESGDSSIGSLLLLLLLLFCYRRQWRALTGEFGRLRREEKKRSKTHFYTTIPNTNANVCDSFVA